MLTRRFSIRRSAKFAGALAMVVGLAAAGRSLQAQNVPAVLSEVPDSAQVVVVINNIKQLSTKLSNAATRMNLPVPQDIVGTITKNVGVKEGLDQNASMAFVVMPGAEKKADDGEENGAGAPEMVMVLPTTDAKAMLAPFKPTAPEKGISEVTLPNDTDEKGYVAVVGKFVALAEKKEHLTHFLAKTKSLDKALTADAAKAIAANDFAAYTNVPAISKAYGKKVDETQQFFTAMIDLQNMAGDEKPGAAAQHALQKEMVGMYFGLAKQFLADANGAVMTARLSDTGLTIGAVSDFKPDSPMGKFVAAQQAKGDSSLKGLPATGEILAAGTIAWDSPTVANLFTTLADKVLAAPGIKPKEDADAAKKAEYEQMNKLVGVQKQLLTLTSGGAFVLLAPPAGGEKAGWMRGAFLADTPEPQKYMDLSMEYLKLSSTGPGGMSEVQTVVTVDEKPVTVKGVKLTKFKVTAKVRDEDSETGKMALEMVKQIYGPNGLVVYSGIVGKRVLSVMGDDAKLVEDSIDAAQKNSDGLATLKEITSVKGEVVANSSIVAYLPVDRWISLGKRAAGGGAAEGGDAPLKIADSPTPMVVSIAAKGSTGTVEVFVPMSTLSQAAQGVQGILPMLMGGGMGGGGMMP